MILKVISSSVSEIINDRRTHTAVLSVIVFSLMAHLYRWTMPGFNHDSLLIYQNDRNWQVSLGRYLQHFYLFIRGKLTAPFLIALFSTFFLTLSAVFIIRTLDIRHRGAIIVIAGLLTTYSTVTETYAGFLHDADIYMLSLLFAVLTIYFFTTYDHGWIISILCITLSLGLYPAYSEVSVVLCLLWLIKRWLAGEKNSIIFKKGLKVLIVLAVGGALYYAGWQLALHRNHIAAADSIHSITGIYALTERDLPEILSLLEGAYNMVFKDFLFPCTNYSLLVGI